MLKASFPENNPPSTLRWSDSRIIYCWNNVRVSWSAPGCRRQLAMIDTCDAISPLYWNNCCLTEYSYLIWNSMDFLMITDNYFGISKLHVCRFDLKLNFFKWKHTGIYFPRLLLIDIAMEEKHVHDWGKISLDNHGVSVNIKIAMSKSKISWNYIAT